jgi:hypothetical protein
MSSQADIKALLKDPARLRAQAKGAFDAVDRDGSGTIDELELHAVMAKVAKAIKAPVPTKQQVSAVIAEIDLNRDGKISFDEYLALVRRTLLKMIGEEDLPAPPKANPDVYEESSAQEGRSQGDQEHLHRQALVFEKYLEESGLSLAFQLVYSEILSKKIEPANVFTYTAMRLRQIGNQVAHLLPKNLTAGLTE